MGSKLAVTDGATRVDTTDHNPARSSVLKRISFSPVFDHGNECCAERDTVTTACRSRSLTDSVPALAGAGFVAEVRARITTAVQR